MLFGKKKVEPVDNFEQAKQELITRRQKIYDEALEHSADPAYSRYITGCKNYLEAAQNAKNMRELIWAERMSSNSSIFNPSLLS